MNKKLRVVLATGLLMCNMAGIADAATCPERCDQKYQSIGETGPLLDCLEACMGRVGNHTERMQQRQEAQNNRNRANKNFHNQQCENEYNARIARGADATYAASIYSHCVQY